MSRYRANSYEVCEPQPSATLNGIDSTAERIWSFIELYPDLGNVPTSLRTLTASVAARSHTLSFRKSCILPNLPNVKRVSSSFLRVNQQKSALRTDSKPST